MQQNNKNSKRLNKNSIIAIIGAIVLYLILSWLGVFGGDTAQPNTNQNIPVQSVEDDVSSDTISSDADADTSDEPVSAPADTSPDAETNGAMTLSFIDVGQGDSILIRTENADILIDGGPGANTDSLIKYLKNQDIDDFELVVATHPHEDHIGGLDDVLKKWDAEQVLMPRKTTDTRAFEKMIDAIEAQGLKITSAKAGQVFELDGMKLTVLSPYKKSTSDEPGTADEVLDPPDGADSDGLNDASVVILLEYAGHTALLTGDAGKNIEANIIDSVPSDIDVYKAAHHGSAKSNGSSYLKKLSPDYSVIPLAADNDYGYPHREVIDILSRYSGPVYRTDENGTVTFTFSKDGVSVNCEKGAA